jgi:UDP-N-acetylglucosamine transferase subunit ALG13
VTPFTVFVTVGTDHHPFHRLVQWADAYAVHAPDARVVVQHGSAPAPQCGEGSALIPPDEMRALVAEADAVVCHGGPATIVEIRDAGKIPIVVPRRSALGEHVDDHQVRFALRVAELGRVVLPATEEDLIRLLDAVRTGETNLRADSDESSVRSTVRLLGDLIDAVTG